MTKLGPYDAHLTDADAFGDPSLNRLCTIRCADRRPANGEAGGSGQGSHVNDQRAPYASNSGSGPGVSIVLAHAVEVEMVARRGGSLQYNALTRRFIIAVSVSPPFDVLIAPGGDADVLIDEPHAAVAQSGVHTAGMPAAGGLNVPLTLIVSARQILAQAG